MACNDCKPKLSDYFHSLPWIEATTRKRYQQKIEIIGFDPYVAIHCNDCQWMPSKERCLMPEVNYADIYRYYVIERSAYTHEDFRCYKSLESYDLFACG